MEEKCQCGMPLNENTCCQCEPTKCCYCCRCPDDCPCGCRQKVKQEKNRHLLNLENKKYPDYINNYC